MEYKEKENNTIINKVSERIIIKSYQKETNYTGKPYRNIER